MALPTTITTITVARALTHAGPFISSAGNVYYVGRSNTDATAVRVVKATDPTVSFATAATDTAGGGQIFGFDIKQNGDDLHILAQEGTIGIGDVAYRRFSMASDTFTQARVVVTANPSFSVSASADCALARRGNGDLIAIYAGNTVAVMGTAYDRLCAKVSTDNGATWGTEFEYSAGGKDVEAHYRRLSAEIGDSDTLHGVYAQGVNLMQRAMSSADVLQTEVDTTFDLNAVPSGSVLNIGKGATFSRTATTRLRFPYKSDTADTEVLRFDAAADPSVFSSDVVDGTNDQLDAGNSQLALDGSTVHAMWARSADDDLYTDNDEDADTWDSAASTFVGTVTLISANIYTRSGSKVLAHVFLDGSTVKYDEDVISAGAPSGTGAQNLQAFSQAGVGEQPHEGTGAQALQAFAQAGIGVLLPSGTGAQSLQSFSQAGVGEQPHEATGTQTLQALSQVGVGEQPHEGTGAQVLQALSQAGVGTTGEATGTGAQDLQALSQAGVGEQPHEGTGAQNLQSLAQAGVGAQAFIGSAAQNLAAVAQAGVGVQILAGTGAQSLVALSQAGIGVQVMSGTGAQNLEAFSQAGAGEQILVAAAAAPAVDRGREAGAGRLRTVDPYELYGTPRKRRETAEAVQVRAAALQDRAEALSRKRSEALSLEIEDRATSTGNITALAREITSLARAADRLDLSAGFAEAHEMLMSRLGEVEATLAHHERLLREDEEIVTILALVI